MDINFTRENLFNLLNDSKKKVDFLLEKKLIKNNVFCKKCKNLIFLSKTNRTKDLYH